jgi:uncharacterized protein YjdB
VKGSDGTIGDGVPAYDYGVRPALKLNLEPVTFRSDTRTFLLKVDVTGVSLNKTETTINVGDAETLTATVEPADTEATGADQTVTWSSSDTGIATVDENGVVTGVAAGTVTITATSVDSPEAKASCDVTVTASTPAEAPPVSVTAHVQRKGTLAAVSGGAIAGTTGKSLRMESIRLTVDGASATGGIEYRGHVQRKGWEKAWARDGAMAGIAGRGAPACTVSPTLACKALGTRPSEKGPNPFSQFRWSSWLRTPRARG